MFYFSVLIAAGGAVDEAENRAPLLLLIRINLIHMAKPKYSGPVTKEIYLEALEKNLGNAYATYHELNLPYNVYCQWREEDPDFAEACEKAKYQMVKFAENKMMDLIANGNEKMVRFLLSAKGNYTTKKEISIDSKNVVDVNQAIDSIKNELEKGE